MRAIVYISVLINVCFCQNGTNFICYNGQTVDISKICNGEKNCSDGSDEKSHLCRHILCSTNEFRCHYGACIANNLKCNGKSDCADGSDENECGNQEKSCKVFQYKCSSGECIPVNKLCNGIADCKSKSDENVCKKISVCPLFTHRCKVGSCIYQSQLCDGHQDCIDGSDELFCKPKQQKEIFCKPITSKRINARCMIKIGSKQSVMSCNDSLPVGTIVHYKCKPYYVPASSNHESNQINLCQIDGTWQRDMLSCIPECGNNGVKASPLIVKGRLAKEDTHPWHAILYLLEDKKWSFICGGTLINEKVVLTAAHCVWETSKSSLKVALGKYYTDFKTKEEQMQIRSISRIFIQPSYQDVEGNYGSDVAVIVLRKEVELSSAVRPVCVDWHLKEVNEQLQEDNIGLIAGMGITENDTNSILLRETSLKVVSNKECIDSQKRDFKKFVTFSTFCAGWENGTNVCNGDSGGGLIFESRQHPGKKFIQGIVSVSPRRSGTSLCDPDHYTVFTKVAVYIKWMKSIVHRIH